MPEQSNEIPIAAIRAAEAGDAAPLVAHLYKSGAIDGVAGLLRRKYFGMLADAQVADCVADAMEATYRAIKDKDTIRHPVAFLMKVASNKAADIIESEVGRTEIDVERLAANPWAPERDSSVREEAKVKALTVARTYVPQLGQDNIQRVMTILLDAVEKNVTDLPHATIAEATGLSVVTVRQLVSRGLRRMCDMAKNDGLHIDKYLIDEYEAVADCEDADSDDGYREEGIYLEDK